MTPKPHGNRRDALLNRFGEATLKRITQDYLDGVTVRELAGRLGVSKGGLEKLLYGLRKRQNAETPKEK